MTSLLFNHVTVSNRAMHICISHLFKESNLTLLGHVEVTEKVYVHDLPEDLVVRLVLKEEMRGNTCVQDQKVKTREVTEGCLH